MTAADIRDTLIDCMTSEGIHGDLAATAADLILSETSGLSVDAAVTAATPAGRDPVVEALSAAFSGDVYQENAEEAASEHEWSWFKWLAVTTAEAVRFDPRCRRCDLGGHTCPGCGADIPHGAFACGGCRTDVPAGEYRCDRDFPGWADLTPEQKGHVADIETAAFWRGHNYVEPPLPAPSSGVPADRAAMEDPPDTSWTRTAKARKSGVPADRARDEGEGRCPHGRDLSVQGCQGCDVYDPERPPRRAPSSGVPADRARDEDSERLRAENDRLAAQNARQAVTVAMRQQSWDEMRRERDALRARIEIQRQTLEGLGAHTDEQTAALTCVAALLAKWQAEADDPDGYDALLFADAAAQLRAALDAQ